ncbi:MAG: hypothetical protein HZA21_03485 [Nitrospirae bacterium]|nr:hypothetical protein [Nitrospirota bacterium]
MRSHGTLVSRLTPYVLVAVGIGLAGCAPAKVTIDASPEIERYRVKTVAVMPFEALTTPQVVDRRDTEFQAPQGMMRSDITFAIPQTVEKFDNPTATVPPHVAAKVTEAVYEKLRRLEGLLALAPDATARAKESLKGKAAGLAMADLAKQVAAQMAADAVLFGRVLVYQEREGGRWGATPSMVGFELKLVAADGRTLWVGNYYEKQKPLNEDFGGFMQRGIGFVTADELVQYGAEHVVQEFPFGGSGR